MDFFLNGNTSNELIEAILSGNITKNFPWPPSKVVKIFLSSTRADFESERNHFHEIVVPKFERLCNNLSLDLLVIDPYWRMKSDPKPNQSNGSHNEENKTHRNESNIRGNSQSSREKALDEISDLKSIAEKCLSYDQYSDRIDPYEFDLLLEEIEQCSIQSLATFFMVILISLMEFRDS